MYNRYYLGVPVFHLGVHGTLSIRVFFFCKTAAAITTTTIIATSATTKNSTINKSNTNNNENIRVLFACANYYYYYYASCGADLYNPIPSSIPHTQFSLPGTHYCHCNNFWSYHSKAYGIFYILTGLVQSICVGVVYANYSCMYYCTSKIPVYGY